MADGVRMGRQGLGAKRQAILAAATRIFVAQGFRRGSLDVIAAEAGVSKQTIYNHFGDKEALVLAVIDAAQGAVRDSPFPDPRQVTGGRADLEAVFRTVGEALVAALLQPDVAALRRMVNVEAPRYPALRTAWVAGGPLRAFEWLLGLLTELTESGDLAVEVPIRAVGQLIAVVGTPVQELSMWGTRALGDDVLAEVVRVETGTFLRAFGTAPRPVPAASPRLMAMEAAADNGAVAGAGLTHGRLELSRAIVAAATGVFLEAGYEGAGVDAIADRAGVSKQTIYNHFGDKQQVLAACVRAAQESARARLDPLVRRLDQAAGDVEATLRACCDAVAPLAIDPQLTALRNLLVFEVPHHPDLRAAWGGGGTDVLVRALTGYFARLAAAGRLAVTDPARPARQLLALASGDARSLAELRTEGLDAVALDLIADGTVGFLLRAYAA